MEKKLSRDWIFNVEDATDFELRLLRGAIGEPTVRYGYIGRCKTSSSIVRCCLFYTTLKSPKQIRMLLPENRMISLSIRPRETNIREYVDEIKSRCTLVDEAGIPPVQGKRPTKQQVQEEVVQVLAEERAAFRTILQEVVKESHQSFQVLLQEIVRNPSMQMVQHNNLVNSTINSNNKSFNLNFFLNETCKNAMSIDQFVNSIQLELADLEDIGRKGYARGISDIIISNLNKLDITERPIHCTDKKREVIYVKKPEFWQKDDEQKSCVREMIRHVARRNVRLLPLFREAHPDCGRSSSKYADQYNRIIVESMKSETVLDDGKIIRDICGLTHVRDCKMVGDMDVPQVSAGAAGIFLKG